MSTVGSSKLKAKKCYGHLGGKLGDLLFERLVDVEWFKPEAGKTTAYEITEKGYQELEKLGIKLDK